MHPITLRLPTDLLTELDEEADEAGFSSRSEYIRHLLQNRDPNELFSSDTDSDTSDHKLNSEIVDTVDKLSSSLITIEDRVDSLEETVDQIELEIKQRGEILDQSEIANTSVSDDKLSTEKTTAQETAHTHDHDVLDNWLRNDGPDSDSAQAVMRDAAQILTDQGPLSANELREQLFNHHPDAYSSADTLWKSTVQRLYEEAPGFSKPEYGKYDYSVK